MNMTETTEKLAFLSSTVQHLAATIETSSVEAIAGRQRLYEGQESLNLRMQRVEDSLKDVKPLAQDFARWRERVFGAAWVIGFVGSLLGALFVLVWAKLTEKAP